MHGQGIINKRICDLPCKRNKILARLALRDIVVDKPEPCIEVKFLHRQRLTVNLLLLYKVVAVNLGKKGKLLGFFVIFEVVYRRLCK